MQSLTRDRKPTTPSYWLLRLSNVSSGTTEDAAPAMKLDSLPPVLADAAVGDDGDPAGGWVDDEDDEGPAPLPPPLPITDRPGLLREWEWCKGSAGAPPSSVPPDGAVIIPPGVSSASAGMSSVMARGRPSRGPRTCVRYNTKSAVSSTRV